MLNSVLETRLLQCHTLCRDGAQHQSPPAHPEQSSSSRMRCSLPIVYEQLPKVITLAAISERITYKIAMLTFKV